MDVAVYQLEPNPKVDAKAGHFPIELDDQLAFEKVLLCRGVVTKKTDAELKIGVLTLRRSELTPNVVIEPVQTKG